MEDVRWKRRSFVTRGPDPTEVVEWTKGNLMIQEFQGVYQVHEKTQDVQTINVLGKALHQKLEKEWQDEQTFGDEDPVNMYGGE